MVSAFVCECHGIMKRDEQQQLLYPDSPVDSTVFMKPGANAEGYWKNSDLVSQVKEKALPLFKIFIQIAIVSSCSTIVKITTQSLPMPFLSRK